MINEYDEIKSLLKKTRMLLEQPETINLAKSIENKIEDTEYKKENESDTDSVKKDKTKTYRISGGLLSLHGKDKKDIELTSDEKQSFQETMDEFVNDVSDLTEYGVLNVYTNEVQWSGLIIDMDVEFFFSVGEKNGVYINGDMIKLDDKLVELTNKLTSYYDKFKAKWAKVIATRRKTQMKEKK
jgi:hypothetical protein